MNILDHNFQNEVKLEALEVYKECWDDILLPQSLLDKFYQIEINEKDILKTFRDTSNFPIKVYFTQFLLNLIFINDLIDEEDTESLFDFWNNSEFTSLFFNNMKTNRDNITNASNSSLSILENHFCDYYCLNFAPSKKDSFQIKPNPEIGDYESRLYTTHSIFNIDPDLKEDESGFVFIKNSFLKESSSPDVLVSGVKLRPGSKKGEKNLKLLSDKVTKAQKVLKECCPKLYSTFKMFTHTIIALNEPGMVSFSLQSLPGYSSINLYERDFVDCIDDLLHENGHHYLNYILNSKDLIQESHDMDYFSPWRMTFRPIRGIYHGTFTFYWALKLFSELCFTDLIKNFLSVQEIQKVRFRFVEEFIRLNACKEPIKRARDLELINEEGVELINSVFKLVDDESDNVKIIYEQLNSDQKDQLRKIKRSLENC